jgi:hypothetical protein
MYYFIIRVRKVIKIPQIPSEVLAQCQYTAAWKLKALVHLETCSPRTPKGYLDVRIQVLPCPSLPISSFFNVCRQRKTYR